jgi:hypothetical protein
VTGRRAGIGFILCVCFAAAVLVSENSIAACVNHDCCGEGCPVCLMIREAENFSRRFGPAVFQSVFYGAVFAAGALVLRLAVFRFIPASSVRLKVKMNR